MSTSRPEFSVIIPSYNRSREVVNALESVLDQSFQDFEIIFVDDGSNDDTIAHVSQNFSDTRLKIHQISHSGRSAARNYGIDVAAGQWKCFLDSDDVYLPETLAQFHENIEKHPEFSAFACEQTFNHEARSYLNVKHQSDAYIFRFRDFLMDNPISLNQLCISHEISCRFPETKLETAEDWYFFRKLTYETSIFKFNYIGVDVNDHQNRSIYTTSPIQFASNNLKSAVLICNELPLTNQERQKLLTFTHLLCANIILSRSKKKKEAYQYFKKAISFRALLLPNFYKAILKFIFF